MHRILLSALVCAFASHAAAQGNAFNPGISLILQGRYADQKDLEERHITGFISGGHEHGGARGFSLDDSELVFSPTCE